MKEIFDNLKKLFDEYENSIYKKEQEINQIKQEIQQIDSEILEKSQLQQIKLSLQKDLLFSRIELLEQKLKTIPKDKYNNIKNEIVEAVIEAELKIEKEVKGLENMSSLKLKTKILENKDTIEMIKENYPDWQEIIQSKGKYNKEKIEKFSPVILNEELIKAKEDFQEIITMINEIKMNLKRQNVETDVKMNALNTKYKQADFLIDELILKEIIKEIKSRNIKIPNFLINTKYFKN